jgi:hypothetical protein
MIVFQYPSCPAARRSSLTAVNARTAVSPNSWLIRERVPQVDDRQKELRLARLEALAAAVERWLADPRYVTEQMMIKALRELERRL